MFSNKDDRFFPLILYGTILAINLIIQQTTPSLISLDSWTIYHILESILNGSSLLPRSVLYSLYPGSYIPLLIPAALFGIYPTLKTLYPMIVSANVLPLYFLGRKTLAPKQAAGATLTIALISDFIIRSISVTPQGIATVFLFTALYFYDQKKWGYFTLFGTFTILTHHLTSLVLILTIMSSIIQDGYHRGKEKLDGKKNAVTAIMTTVFLLDWAFVSYFSGKLIVSNFLLIHALPAIIITGTLLLITRKKQSKLLDTLEKIPYRTMVILTSFISIITFITLITQTTHSFLSVYGYKSLAFIPLYIFAPIAGIGLLTKRRDKTWLIFFTMIMLIFSTVMILRLNCIFDAYRLLPFALIPLILSIFEKKKRLGTALLIMAIVSLAGHGYATSSTLTYHPQEIAAAEYARKNLPKGTVATDTKMSGLFLGVANMPATFEGSYWLFTQDDLKPWIKTFNEFRFKDNPIRYIVISQYMFETGADISWSTTRQKINKSNIKAFEKIGEMVFKNSEVAIWEINPNAIEEAEILPIQTPPQTLSIKLFEFWSRQSKGKEEITIQPKTAYGSTCNN